MPFLASSSTFLQDKYVMKILLFIWQLPQNLLALILILLSRKKELVCDFNTGLWYRKCSIITKDSAISLGNFILSSCDLPDYVLKHEHGHQIQSLYFGPLYLILVGIPSILRVIYFNIFRKSYEWYHSGYPENWADKLGGVK